MNKGIKKLLTLGLVGMTVAGATVAPISAAEVQNDTVVYEETLLPESRAIASFRTFNVGSSTYKVKLTGMPVKGKQMRVMVVRGSKTYVMDATNVLGSEMTIIGDMISTMSVNLGKIKTGDKLRVEVRDQILGGLIYDKTTTAK